MTITITMTTVAIALILVLFLAPIFYAIFIRQPGGDYDFPIDVFLLVAACWAGAIALAVGMVVGRYT